jgi:transposase
MSNESDLTLEFGAQDCLFEPEIVALEDSVPRRKAHVRSQRVFRQGVEPELYPGRASELVPPDNVAHLIVLVVSLLDLSLLKLSYEDHGGVGYEPDQMLGVILLAYALGITSCSEMEDRCKYDVRFMLVARGLQPDERTLRRFRLRLKTVMDEFFKQVLGICKEKKILKLERVAIDGTKIKSAASQLERWLDQKDRDLIEEAGLEVPECSDPEARLVRSAHGFVIGYNAQAAVDVESGLIVGHDVFDSSSDRALLPAMIERVEELAGQKPAEVVADGGYDSYESYQAAENSKVEVIVAPQDKTALFWTAISETEVVCPMGHSPTTKRNTTSNKKPCIEYSVPECPTCVFASSCSKSGNGRVMKAPPEANPVLRVINAHYARSPDGKQALVERMASVEPVFGRTKGNKNMVRFRLRGLNKVRLEFGLMMLVENIMILGRHLLRLFDRLQRIQLAISCKWDGNTDICSRDPFLEAA